MSIKHPYLTGPLSTRINAICKDQKTESLIFRALSRDIVKEHTDDFMDYIANKDELYSQANQQILEEMNVLINGEFQEKLSDTDRDENY